MTREQVIARAKQRYLLNSLPIRGGDNFDFIGLTPVWELKLWRADEKQEKQARTAGVAQELAKAVAKETP